LGEVQVLRHAADLETIDFLHQRLIIELLLALSGASDSQDRSELTGHNAHILQVVQQFGIPHLFELPIRPTVCAMSLLMKYFMP